MSTQAVRIGYNTLAADQKAAFDLCENVFVVFPGLIFWTWLLSPILVVAIPILTIIYIVRSFTIDPDLNGRRNPF